MSKRAYDPLASIKIFEDKQPSPEISPLAVEPEAKPEEPKPVVIETKPAPKVETPKVENKLDPKPVVNLPPPPVSIPKYRVTAMKKLAYRGHILTLKLGKIVSDETHGAGAIEHFKRSGVSLEPV